MTDVAYIVEPRQVGQDIQIADLSHRVIIRVARDKPMVAEVLVRLINKSMAEEILMEMSND